MLVLKIFFICIFLLSSSFAHDEEPKVQIKNSLNNKKHSNNLTSKENQYLKKKKMIKICIDPDWMPFEKINKNGEHIGISYDYFNIFQKQINIPIKLVNTDSWTQTLSFLREKKCDILTLGNVTPERKTYLNFTKAYLKIPFIISTKNEQYYVNDLKYLKGKTVGVVKNNALMSILQKKYPNFIIKEVNSNKDGLEQVQENKLYAFAGNMLSISHILQTEYMNDLKIMSKLGNEKSNLAIGVRNDDLMLLQIFNKLVDNLSEETHQEIINKYLSIKYEQNINYKYLPEIIVFVFLILFTGGFIHYQLKQINNKLRKKVKERTDQLLKQSRLAQMGEMISMIAHQWRQPLTAISATTNSLLIKLILEEKISNNDLRKEILLISDYAQHLSMTIDDFRNFFKKDKEKSSITLEKIIKNSMSIVNPSLESKGIELKVDFNCNKELKLFSSEVNQVLLNIIKNSEDALFENNISNPLIIIRTFFDQTYAIIEIEDNAGGVPEDIIDKVFDPYFSTKESKDGTGLGLYMSKLIINDHCNGKLNIKNSQDGAIFKIRIPL